MANADPASQEKMLGAKLGTAIHYDPAAIGVSLDSSNIATSASIVAAKNLANPPQLPHVRANFDLIVDVAQCGTPHTYRRVVEIVS